MVAGSTTVRSRWARWAISGLMLLGLGASVPFARAQTSAADMAAARMPEKSYMAKNTLSLPVIVDDRARGGLREIQLLIKDGPHGVWHIAEKAAPSKTSFVCTLPQDGEYWFNVVTIDQAGNATPPDVSKEPPAVIVVLDTTAPQVELRLLPDCPACADGVCVKCEVKDANPNPFQTKLEYQTQDLVWRCLEPMANQPDCFCIPRQAMLTGMVKVSCMDRAMNATVRPYDLASLGFVSGPTIAAQPPSHVVQAVANTELPKMPFSPPPTVVSTSSKSVVQEHAAVGSSVPKDLHVQVPDMVSVPTGQPSLAPQPSCEQQCEAHQSGAKWLMVNHPRVSMDYSIEDVGKSGVGKVEVWITKDNGQSWDVLCDDPDKTSPAIFDLPGEGVYGIRLVVTNGRGFCDNVPKPGDVPEYIVELDTTKPRAELLTAELGPTTESACVDITWKAEDKNLGTAPIELWYSVSAQGPWTPIVKGMANTGAYRWFLPQAIGRQAYVRLVAVDMAGNSTRCDCPAAVPLDDMSRPHATIGTIVSASKN